MIAGGKDKGISYDAIGPEINEHVKALILCGATAGVIRAAVEKAANFTGLPITEVDSYQSAVALARETARPGMWCCCPRPAPPLTGSPTSWSGAGSSRIW